MKKFLALSRVSLQTMLLGLNTRSKNKKKRRIGTLLGSVLLIAGVSLYISGVYSAMILEVLAPIRMERLLFLLMGIAALVSGVMFTAFSVKSTLFGGQDNDLLLSMPVSTRLLLLGRVTAIYLESLLFTFFMLVPAGVACAIMSQTGLGRSVDFWVRLLVIVFTLPLMDTALSVLLGAIIAAISTLFPRQGFGQTLVTGLYLCVILWFSFNITNYIAALATHAAQVLHALRWLKPVMWLADGIVGSWRETLLFALLCAALFATTVVILGAVFRKAVTAFASRRARSDYRLTRQHSRGAIKALIGKETRRLFGSPTWFWNGALGFVMLIACGVMLFIRRGDIAMVIGLLPDSSLLVLIGMGAAAFCLSTGSIASPAVSLEGKSLWVLREAPVSTRAILAIKTGLQLMLGIPTVLIFTALLLLSRVAGVGSALYIGAFALIFEIGHACWGMLMGLQFPRLDAPSEAAVVKQSLTVFLAVFPPMLVPVLGAAAGWGLSALGLIPPFTGLTAGAFAATALFTLLSVALLLLRGERMFLRLSE